MPGQDGIVEALRREIHDLSTKVVELSVELKSFKETTIPVFKALGGIGDPDSLGTKITVAELQIKNIQEEMKNYTHQRFMIWAAVISGGLGFLSSVFSALLSFLGKK